ncbi:C4-dicarboxylate ABC transporter substrate-binding protein [Litchfieldella qijiaojingensis]|uniref:C4-dicarboxylate ABC transporter substrate-binding protein n=1 Tax=Litchfieldella qijiaojingensis TaxID=980347 RepID=A0ABQ2YTE2_9GAMM|nr:TAXI family TRAP transporter solute-binding subunit [Halomonas qijiaojingensis]GGX93480.1 C4-dicarboxylate ABC transporter substrate-binding protein [Halomonas qijiaojingensis]
MERLGGMMGRCLVALLEGLLVTTLLLPFPAVGDEPVVIGTASTTGVYHITGRAICRLLEAPCEARPSAGSAANLEAVRNGSVPIALAQSDLQYYAVEGIEGFAEAGQDTSLRALFSVHSEPFTLVVRRDSNIQSLDDLPGHSVNIGNPGSGQRGTMQKVMDAKGWTPGDFSPANQLPADQQSLELCHGRIEAMVYTVGHPNPSIEQAIRLCDAALIDVKGPEIDALVNEAPYYSYATIPEGLYRDDFPGVETFGVRATLVASENTDPDMVYRVVAAVFDNFEDFRAFHPAFSVLTPEQMIHEGLSAPLHEGALRYYMERGWAEEESDEEEETEQQEEAQQEE